MSIAVQKAILATLVFGDINLDVLKFPDGSYHLFINQLNEELSIKASDKTGKKYLQPLIDKDPKRVNKASVEGIKSHLKTLSLDLVCEAIQVYAGLGNAKCIAIAIASLAESLERRADAAFNVLRTEEERNLRFIVRRDGILSRHFWTDCIDNYCKTHEVSENYRKWIYIHVSDQLNRSLFGKTSKEIRDFYDIGDLSPRDYFPSETLKIVDTVEKATALRVLQTDSEPKQALKDVVALLGIDSNLKL